MVPTQPFWHKDAVEWERPPHRAKAHAPLREILAESGVALASQPIARRASYQSIGAAGTLQTVAKTDPKAIAEMETLLGEILALYRSTAEAVSA